MESDGQLTYTETRMGIRFRFSLSASSSTVLSIHLTVERLSTRKHKEMSMRQDEALKLKRKRIVGTTGETCAVKKVSPVLETTYDSK
jgi:hypothetical protein